MLNQVVLVGRIYSIEEGAKKIIVALQRQFKNEEGEYETDLIPVALFNGIAQNVMEYCKVGDLVGVKGRIQTIPDYMDDQQIMIVCEKITFLSSKSGDGE